jgi:hypothetical protein
VKVWQLHERLVHALGQDLPPPLVADHVVELLARLHRRRHEVGHPLRQREGLIDQGTLGGAEELPRELRVGDEVTEGQAAVDRADLPPQLGHRPDHVLDRQRARIDAVHGGDDLARDANGRQACVGEARSQPRKLLPRLRLRLAAGGGPAMGPPERVT